MVEVYGGKGGSLRGERWKFTGGKVEVYGEGGSLRGSFDFLGIKNYPYLDVSK